MQYNVYCCILASSIELVGNNSKNMKDRELEQIVTEMLHDNDFQDFAKKCGLSRNFSIVLASVKYSGMGIVDMAGKVNGTVMSRNKGGSYARVWVKPTNPRSIHQVFQRDQLATLSAGFRGLGQPAISQWNASSVNFPVKNRLGETIHLSGIDLYVALNVNLISIGLPIISVPPVPQDTLGFNTLTMTSVLGVVKLVFTPTPSPTTSNSLIFATPGLSAGISFVKSQYRLIGFMPHTSASPFDITTMYTTRFGAPIVGTQVFANLRPVNIVSGQQQLGIFAKIIIA